MEKEIKGKESTSVQYYLKHRDTFSLRDEDGDMRPGALFHKEKHVFWKGKTLKENKIDYSLFAEGQLKYRRLNNNADY